jgi:hypothetical protein
MGLLAWLRRDSDASGEAAVSQTLIANGTDMAVRLTNPRLKLVRRYRQRLAPAVETAIRFLRDQIPKLPATREATRAAWSSDSSIHAFFATANDLPKIFSRSNELREFFDKAPALKEVHAVLGMQMIEQKVLGMAQEGEILRREVPQTTVSFSDHRIRFFGETEIELRRVLGTRIFEQFALIALARISGGQKRVKELKYNRELMKTRLKVLDRQGVGLAGMGSDAAGPRELTKLRSRLEENERELGSIATGADVLDRELEILREVLASPVESVRFSSRRLSLTPLNVLAEGEASAQGREVEFCTVQIAAEPPIERAFALVRFPRAELLAGGMRFDEAASLLQSGRF